MMRAFNSFIAAIAYAAVAILMLPFITIYGLGKASGWILEGLATAMVWLERYA